MGRRGPSPDYAKREKLAGLLRDGTSLSEAARLMGRAPSTISRELRRGSDARGRYHPFEAQRRALGRRRVQRTRRLSADPVLGDWVATKLKARWSPEQIAIRSRRQFPDEPARWLCAETIYQAVYRPDLGGLPRELPGRVLRRRHLIRRRDAQRRRSGPVTGMTMIHDRDAAVLDRGEVGHWEGDLIMGAGNATAIVTLVERVTRLTLLGYLPAGPTTLPTWQRAWWPPYLSVRRRPG